MRSLENKKVLITGGTGFIGEALSKRLIEENCIVYNLGRRPSKYQSEFIFADIRNSLHGKLPPVDIVYHVGAVTDIVESQKNPEKVFGTNVLGTINLMRALSESSIEKFIYLSSVGVYGNPDVVPTPENSIFRPLEFYGYTKFTSEFLVKHFCSKDSHNYNIIRSYNAYGPGQRENLVLSAMLNSAYTGKIIVRNSENTRDFIFIDDLIDAIVLSTKLPNNYIFNVGTGIETSLFDLAKIISSQFDRQVKVSLSSDTHLPSDMNVFRSAANISSITRETGWKPKYDIKQGIQATINYYVDIKTELEGKQSINMETSNNQ